MLFELSAKEKRPMSISRAVDRQRNVNLKKRKKKKQWSKRDSRHITGVIKRNIGWFTLLANVVAAIEDWAI